MMSNEGNEKNPHLPEGGRVYSFAYVDKQGSLQETSGKVTRVGENFFWIQIAGSSVSWVFIPFPQCGDLPARWGQPNPRDPRKQLVYAKSVGWDPEYQDRFDQRRKLPREQRRGQTLFGESFGITSI